MKISYRRELKHNYLIIEPEELAWRTYECNMLEGNTIEGVLRFQFRQMDGEVRFYYEITSRQPLDRLLENQAVKAAEIKRLVFGIAAVVDRAEQYLLREGSILLDPEYIYVDPDSFRIWLCLVPGLDRDFPEAYGKLLEYILGKVDHQDKDSVVLAYGLYQETRKENYGMEDILRFLGADGAQNETQRKKEETHERETETVENGIRLNPEAGQSRGRNEDKEKYPVTKPGVPPEKAGIWKRFLQWIKGKKKDRDEEQIQVPLEMLFRDEAEETAQGTRTEARNSGTWNSDTWSNGAWNSGMINTGTLSSGNSNLRNVRPGSVNSGNQMLGRTSRSTAPEKQAAEEHDTVLLADLTQTEQQGARWLRSLNYNIEDIQIPYYPFVIGKQENLVDYQLAYGTVSRLHVKIDQKDGGWSIQDLNSSNGTKVCGIQLENNEITELKIGDEVQIAEFRYRFE